MFLSVAAGKTYVLCHDLSQTHPYLILKTPWINMSDDCGVELHSLVTTEDAAFVSFYYVYLYLTFVYNLSARHTKQCIWAKTRQ